LAAARKNVKVAKKKLSTQKKECALIDSHREKYMAAIKLITMAEANMKYADTYIPQLKAAAAEYLRQYTELKNTESDHRATIAKHAQEIKNAKETHKQCTKDLNRLKTDKKNYETCANNLTSYTKKVNTCKAENEKAKTLHQTLSNASTKLNHKISTLKASAQNWKKLAEEYKPREEKPIEEEKIVQYTGPHTLCHSTGDPHYVSWTNKRFDIYGFEGDFVLAESPDEDFVVETRIAYQRNYANRGLNQGVAVQAEGIIFESLEGQLKIDGQVKNLAVGSTTNLRHGVTIKRVNAVTYLIITPDGGKVQFQQVKLTATFWYHQVYVYVPNAWVGKAKGLCAGNPPTAAQIKALQVTDQSKRKRIFGVAYNPPVGNHAVATLKWKNAGFEKEAQALCLKATGKDADLYHDCLMDAKVCGNLEMIKDYQEERKSIKDLEKQDAQMRAGPLGTAYRYLAHLLSELSVQSQQLKKYDVVKDLKSLKLDTNLAAQVEGIEARMNTEIHELRNLQQELALKITK